MTTRTLIKDGTVVTARRTPSRPTSGSRTARSPRWSRPARSVGTADTTIDAKGKYVIPGGIDCHTHMELPFGGTTASDDFDTGTVAAAHGGTTTIVDFAIQSKGGSMRAGLDTWFAQGRGQGRDRLRLPHDHDGGEPADARRDGRDGPRGRDVVQDVHGLPGRVPRRRSADLPRDAARRRARRADHDARRDRPADRRARAAGARRRPHRAGLSRAHAPRGRRGRRAPSARSRSPRWRACRSTWCTSRRSARSSA